MLFCVPTYKSAAEIVKIGFQEETVDAGVLVAVSTVGVKARRRCVVDTYACNNAHLHTLVVSHFGNCSIRSRCVGIYRNAVDVGLVACGESGGSGSRTSDIAVLCVCVGKSRCGKLPNVEFPRLEIVFPCGLTVKKLQETILANRLLSHIDLGRGHTVADKIKDILG